VHKVSSRAIFSQTVRIRDLPERMGTYSYWVAKKACSLPGAMHCYCQQ